MSKVFLVDSQRKPLDPIYPGWARRLLSSGQAAQRVWEAATMLSGQIRFPQTASATSKKHFGYQTGDLVRAVVLKGKYQGVHVGRVLARATGKFDIETPSGKAQGISYKYCHPVHQSDGYSYVVKGERHSSLA